MPKWENFEIECTNYLNNYYGDYAKFTHQGGANSTISDIFVETNDSNAFYIEVKASKAQSGQFVLIPDNGKKKFVFSPRNKTETNDFTKMITEHMNSDFDCFNNAGTVGQNLDIDNNIFGQWIVNYFKSKGVKYFITKDTDYIIFPTSKFETYFNITAKYRVKRSGSSEPSKKYQPIVVAELQSEYGVNNAVAKDKKLFVTGNSSLNKVRFIMGDYEYYLAPKDESIYEVRQLSNTYNMNVIFSISLQKGQDPLDLKTFETEIKI